MKKKSLATLAMVLALGMTTTAFAADSVFSDVPAKHWAYESVAKLAKAGIIEGNGNQKFEGDRILTRYEMTIIVGNAMTKLDKADEATKAEILKLEKEFSNELAQLGNRVTNVETKVNKAATGKVDFSFWGRILMAGYKDPIKNTLNGGTQATATDNMDTQIRYKLKMKSQLSENVWAYSVMGTDQGYNTDASNTNSWMGGVMMQKMYVKVKTGDWYTNFGRQSDNESNGPGLIGGGMFMASSSGFDGLSTYYVDPKNNNNKFQVGYFNRAFGGAVRNVKVANAYYDIAPNFNLIGAYFADGGKKGVSDSTLADIVTVGFDTKFGKDNKWRILAEYGKNRTAKQAAAYEGQGSLYTGQNTGWDIMLQYGQNDITKPGTWDIQVDLRRFQPGFNPYGGTEWIGGVYTPSNVGAYGNADNMKGVGVYFDYVPFKNIYTQLSWYYMAPVAKGTGDGKYRQSYRLLFDYMY